MRPLHGLRQPGRVLERVVPAVEVDVRLRPEPVHDLELLGEHLHAHGRLREREAEGAVLPLHPAGAEPELDPAAGDVVDGRGCIREQRGRRNVAGETSVPKRSVVVRAASAASVVQASCATFASSSACEM